MLLWKHKHSVWINLCVIAYIFDLFSENKYDDNDASATLCCELRNKHRAWMGAGNLHKNEYGLTAVYQSSHAAHASSAYRSVHLCECNQYCVHCLWWEYSVINTAVGTQFVN